MSQGYYIDHTLLISDKMQVRADLALGGALALSPLWANVIGEVNQILALIGGIIGITIGLIRLYRLWTRNGRSNNGNDM